jgi:hypothetical protein
LPVTSDHGGGGIGSKGGIKLNCHLAFSSFALITSLFL